MFKALKARLSQGYRTGKFPKVEPVLPNHFAGRPVWKKDACNNCKKCLEVCPTNAIAINENSFALDTGKCIFCNNCAEVCDQGALTLSSEYRLAAMTRNNLIASDAIYEPERPTNREF